ncbi:MAG: PAS domain-containing protein [Thermoleophilaceae bacterium]|nr:PAS domain-containing protein [Thermoleophilaceae bacterium]
MRFGLTVAGATAAVLALVAGLALLIWSDLDPRERDVVGPILEHEVGVAVGGALLLAALLTFGLAAFLGRYARPATRLAAAARLMAEANREHRAEPEGAPELRGLAEALNALGERHAEARREVERAAARGRAELEEERDRLAAVMSELTRAVVVCNLDGRILLYNEAAADLLGGERAGAVGLGRSLFAVLDRSLVTHALEEVRERSGRDTERPVARFAAPLGEAVLRVELAPVRDREGETSGFVLMAEDVTAAAERSGRRDALLRSLSEGARASVANLRAAAEAMLDWGELDAAQRTRFLEIVREEAVRLSGRVEEGLAASTELVEGQWTLDEMRGADLLAALRRAVARRTGLPVRAEPEPDEELWLAVDSYSLGWALVAAAERLRQEQGVSELELALGRDAQHVHLDLRWPGAHLGPDLQREWEERSLSAGNGGPPFTVREVLSRHGAEAWSTALDDGRALLRVVLPPLAARTLMPSPARGPRPSLGSRPEFYDFDLFERTDEGSPFDDRPLERLTYTVFDTETTGLDPAGGDELVSIGAVRIVNGRVLGGEVFEQLIDPRRSVPEAAVRVHGISRDMLEGQPPVEEVLPRFARFAEDTVLIGHDVAFDLRFFELKEHRTGVRLTQPVLDTLLLDAVANPEHEDHSIEAMAERLGVSVVGRHTALGDALVTAEIFVRLLPLLRAAGIETLRAAREAARRTRAARVSSDLYARR